MVGSLSTNEGRGVKICVTLNACIDRLTLGEAKVNDGIGHEGGNT